MQSSIAKAKVHSNKLCIHSNNGSTCAVPHLDFLIAKKTISMTKHNIAFDKKNYIWIETCNFNINTYTDYVADAGSGMQIEISFSIIITLKIAKSFPPWQLHKEKTSSTSLTKRNLSNRSIPHITSAHTSSMQRRFIAQSV